MTSEQYAATARDYARRSEVAMQTFQYQAAITYATLSNTYANLALWAKESK